MHIKGKKQNKTKVIKDDALAKLSRVSALKAVLKGGKPTGVFCGCGVAVWAKGGAAAREKNFYKEK